MVTKLAYRCEALPTKSLNEFIRTLGSSLKVRTVWLDRGDQRIKRHLFSDADIRQLLDHLGQSRAEADRQLQQMTKNEGFWKNRYDVREIALQKIEANALEDAAAPWKKEKRSPKSYLQVMGERNICLTKKFSGGLANGIRKKR
jgi:hypothetical protein